jgi:hypothetical protein
MNNFVGDYVGLSVGNQGNTGYRVFNRMADFTRPGPSMTFVFLDECPDSINDGLFHVSMIDSAWHDVVASLHCGGGDLSFADGHAEVHKWRDPNSRKPVNHGASGTYCPAYGTKSPRDYLWLQERTTAK